VPDLRRNLGALAVCSLALLLPACSKVQPAPPLPPDAGSQPDSGPIVDYTDTDGDGLCDRTERARGTNPEAADTDGDGVPDRAEIELGFNPTRTDSPDRDLLVRIGEAPGSAARVPIPYVVNGRGASYGGAFRSLYAPSDLDAGFFYAGSFAFAADPLQNVYAVLPEEERFDRVNGRTRLIFETFFETPLSLETRGCIHAYPWRYEIKRDDGTLVFARRYILVVTPAGATEWCVPPGLCI